MPLPLLLNLPMLLNIINYFPVLWVLSTFGFLDCTHAQPPPTTQHASLPPFVGSSSAAPPLLCWCYQYSAFGLWLVSSFFSHIVPWIQLTTYMLLTLPSRFSVQISLRSLKSLISSCQPNLSTWLCRTGFTVFLFASMHTQIFSVVYLCFTHF